MGEPSSKVVWLVIQDNSLPEHGSHNRHYHFAKQLASLGFLPVVFSASKSRHSDKQLIEGKVPYLVDESHGFPFVYIRTPDYGGSMKKRLMTMVEFHARLHRHRKDFPKPAVVLGSSPYPLSPLLAIRLAKEFGGKSICEVRDLWPLSLEEYGIVEPGGFVASCMYRLEKYLYSRADEVVFTQEGAKSYIEGKGWSEAGGHPVRIDRVHYINNGIDLGEYDADKEAFVYEDRKLSDDEGFKVVYTGSIRRANDIGFILEVARELESDGVSFFLFGDGEEKVPLERRCADEAIDNVHFMGRVDKRYIPSILSQGMLLLMHSRAQYGLSNYGMSQNKLFDYLASGKPIISNLPNSYSIINRYDCGFEGPFDTPQDCARQILRMKDDPASLERWGRNSRQAASLFTFEALTRKLSGIIDRP
ncbi:glycosyltransferase [Gordonibacter sp. ResAG-26]|uniref:Glycosyltransferase n=1 Tax=Gordonibacter urolithinfaciens TaxID=1335613 RepID=A0A6N8IJE4_9ACTN|nr:glycosyltransferase [Gordonibacter urolithinfaciens]MVN15967.1 glycosyltransferase [Gordonibacter urolithinfaciens]MVN39511.1 glycosyltransferase [Gordonibacter urolithinfaciens]MVN56471.1 glycosyltransferase [Gordonibacter urolithinfaciens]MVN61705.1 glycosyltransferase [Gordonibacter urolithinfaciens]